MRRMLALATIGIVTFSWIGCTRITTQLVEKPRLDQEITGNQGVLVGKAEPAPPRRETRQILEINVDLPTMAELNPWRVSEEKPAAQMAAIPSGQVPSAAVVKPGPSAYPELPKPTLQTPALEPLAAAPSGQVPSAAVVKPEPPAYLELPKPTLQTPALELRQTASSPQPVSAAMKALVASTYTVQEGDTLDKIADSFYGDSRQWQRIFEANRETLGTPNRIYKGQKLRIPAPKPSARMDTEEGTDFK